ncbi:MAG: SUMF1/EgtB/PvdO family nonheme iron enzyme, partial [Deltaproteobacteria bacterium]|nr:SUMF1/EgtB/PvdO family nonheme iron enzyme [Deltaproteobacteria bacterium]
PCGKTCPQGEVCSAGQGGLLCVGGTTKCGSKCTDVQLDPGNCGSCGKACAQGEVCSAGLCALVCFGGTIKCGGVCSDTKTDPANCGGCGKACAQGEACVSSACKLLCGQGKTNCGGKCVDLATDTVNCGSCSRECEPGATCQAGECPCKGHLWSKRFGDGSYQNGEDIAADGAGNVVVTGWFQGTTDFGGGPLTSAGGDDIFVAKLDKDGKHLWSKRFGDGIDQEGVGVAVDGAGSVVVTGYFAGAVDFGGGPLSSAGGWDIFLAKYDKDGKHLWSKRFGGGVDDFGSDVGTDGAGNVLLTGYFQGTADFGGGPLPSAGLKDVFLAKYDTNGQHLWSKRFGDGSDQQGNDVVIDGAGNALLTGWFQGTADFGGGPLASAGLDDVFLAKYDKALPSAGLKDLFLAKYDTNGQHLWSKRFGDGSDQLGLGITVDAAGNVLVTGMFKGTTDFGGGPLAAGSWDIFVAKYDKDGKHQWSKRFGDGDEQVAFDIATDGSGNALVAGDFLGTVDFGGGPLTNGNVKTDLFVAKFDGTGSHVWSKQFAGTSDVGPYGIAADGSGSAFVTGYFKGTADFGGGPLVSAGLYDVFVAKLGACMPPPSCNGGGPGRDDCGPQEINCCNSKLVPGGSFYRSYDGVTYNDKSYPATLSDFRLDTYEVTVGRFRAFVDAGMGTQQKPPAPGAGAHPKIPNSGWDAGWNGQLPADTEGLKAGLKCFRYKGPTWTDSAAANEKLPINCASWYEGFAFCAWDGGRLTTEAEWNYAAAGGNEQRVFPWSSPPNNPAIDQSYAVCAASFVLPVASRSPKGDGRWGHADIAFNEAEWLLDYYGDYPNPCVDCARLTPSCCRARRGGSWSEACAVFASSNRDSPELPDDHRDDAGLRCARQPL